MIAAAGLSLGALLLGACDSQSTVNAPTGSTAAGTANPTVARSPTPAPSRDPGRVALTKFFALVADDGFAYQATFTGKSRHTVDILPISNGLLQVSGPDVRVRATFTFKSGAKATVEHRSVSGKAWIRYGSEAWERLTAFPASSSMAAFASVKSPPDVTYLGPAEAGGKTAYRVSMASAIVHPIMIPASNLTEVAVTSSKLELLIDAAGRPISGTATITGRGRVSGQLQEIVIDLKVAFTKVGQKVAITAP
ncbi:MAG TPA: hypothetical protein VFY18_02880 [Candidatus Limnocylindrales bacterium]|nr:hypothetical protein [Candidatus Limnocylindrales bacterium]